MVCGLFNGVVCSSDDRMLNNKLEGIRKEAAIVSFKVLSRPVPGGTEENHEGLQAAAL